MFEIWSLVGLFAFYLVTDEWFGQSGYLTANLVGPLVMTVVLGHSAWRMARADARNIWTALFWFRLSTGTYFGVGTFIIFIVNNATLLYIEDFHQFSEHDVLKMNMIVSLSTVLILVAARVVLLMGRRWTRGGAAAPEVSARDRTRNLLAAGTLFLAVGLTVNYGINVPHAFGWTNAVLPGSLTGLARFTMLGVFMLALWSLQRARWLLPAIAALAAIEMLFQLLMFSKSNTLLILIMFLLAFLWRKISIVRSIICAALVVGTYAYLQPLVSYCRTELAARYGDDTQVSFGQRFDILTSYTPSPGPTVSTQEQIQGALSRLSYVNAATFLIDQYDHGAPGEWQELLPAVFVPRFLWAEKPIISDVGFDIYELGTGRRTSSSGAGIYADSYWVMGWWGVIIYMPIFGVILGVLSASAARFLRQGKWLLFPVVLMGMQMGYRTDGHYITDVAGAGVILAGMYVVLALADQIMSSWLRSFAGHGGRKHARAYTTDPNASPPADTGSWLTHESRAPL